MTTCCLRRRPSAPALGRRSGAIWRASWPASPGRPMMRRCAKRPRRCTTPGPGCRISCGCWRTGCLEARRLRRGRPWRRRPVEQGPPDHSSLKTLSRAVAPRTSTSRGLRHLQRPRQHLLRRRRRAAAFRHFRHRNGSAHPPSDRPAGHSASREQRIRRREGQGRKRSGRAGRAMASFDLGRRPCQTREKGGRHDHRILLGRTLLLARRWQLCIDPAGRRLRPAAARRPAGKPETKRRLKNLAEVSGLWREMRTLSAAPASHEELARVHPESYLAAFKAASDAGGGNWACARPSAPAAMRSPRWPGWQSRRCGRC